MVDNRSIEKRSQTMSKVRSKDTGPEMIVRRLLHKMGYRYRLHRKDLPGTPDIVFPARKKAIFVNGCFWHLHGCKLGKPPKSKQGYWLPKLRKNQENDIKNIGLLEGAGWQVMVVWQCQISGKEALRARLRGFLEKGI